MRGPGWAQTLSGCPRPVDVWRIRHGRGHATTDRASSCKSCRRMTRDARGDDCRVAEREVRTGGVAGSRHRLLWIVGRPQGRPAHACWIRCRERGTTLCPIGEGKTGLCDCSRSAAQAAASGTRDSVSDCPRAVDRRGGTNRFRPGGRSQTEAAPRRRMHKHRDACILATKGIPCIYYLKIKIIITSIK